MNDDVTELLVRGQEEIQRDLRAVKETVTQIRISMAYNHGKQKGRATILGAISGLVTSVLVYVFGHSILPLLPTFKK